MGKIEQDPVLSKDDLTFYAGLWVARIGQQIVGQGGTPKQALQAAKSARHKEKPEVIFVPSTNIHFSPLLNRLCSILPESISVYLVGGALRDTLLQRPNHDFDFALAEDAIPVARRVADQLGASFYPLDKIRRAARLIFKDENNVRQILDFTTFRGPDLETDLKRRDFTINALAVDIRRPQELLDPLGGAADLRSKTLRACSQSTFIDDPIRILRAIRTAAGLNFQILPDTRVLINPAVKKLEFVSPERLRDEIFAILAGPRVATSMRALAILGVFEYILPELVYLKGLTQSHPHTKDVWEHTLDTLDHLERLLYVLGLEHDLDASANLKLGLAAMHLGRFRKPLSSYLQSRFVPENSLRSLLFFAALYHDIGKPNSQRTEDKIGRVHFQDHAKLGARIIIERAKKLHLSNAEQRWLEIVVREHMGPAMLARNNNLPDAREIYRYFRNTGSEGVAVAVLSLADLMGTYGVTLSQKRWKAQIDVVRKLLEGWWEHHEEYVDPPVLLNGHDLMETFSIMPSSLVGEFIETIREAQAAGEIKTKEQGLALIAEQLTN